jgi:endonuclease G
MTPSVSSYYYEKESDKEIAGLETPMLTKGETLILHTGFSLVYNEETEQASWVAYHLTRDELYGLFEREDNFRPDSLITTESAQLDDYRKSGYDRGHLIPAADATWSEQAMSDTFYLSNMSPQEPSFNRGIWADLEAVVRNFAATEGSVYVVTGPIFYPETQIATIGVNNVAVPDAYFKVVLDYVEPEVKAIGFILEHEGSKEQLQNFAVSVDEVEQVTQIDFFPLLENEIEDALEATYDVSLWDFDEFSVSKEERKEYLRNKESGSEQEPVIIEKENTIYNFLLDIMMESKKELRKLFQNLDIEQVFGEVKGIFT